METGVFIRLSYDNIRKYVKKSTCRGDHLVKMLLHENDGILKAEAAGDIP
jgi:hypothetical protein